MLTERLIGLEASSNMPEVKAIVGVELVSLKKQCVAAPGSSLESKRFMTMLASKIGGRVQSSMPSPPQGEPL